MTTFDKIKDLDFDSMVSLLTWGVCFYPNLEVPSCDEGCSDFGAGCAKNCPNDKREMAVRKWLEMEVEE